MEFFIEGMLNYAYKSWFIPLLYIKFGYLSWLVLCYNPIIKDEHCGKDQRSSCWSKVVDCFNIGTRATWVLLPLC